MSTWALRYARLGEGAERVQVVTTLAAKVGPGARLEDDGKSAFVAWTVPAPSFQPDDELAAVSREVGEAISLQVQTVADLVIYDHFVAGERVRGLTFAGEAGWVRVVGEPEPWEARALFSSTRLAELSADLEEDVDGEELAREKAELERLWRLGKVVEGSARPAIDPSSLARSIEKHFGLPGRPGGSLPHSGSMPHG